MIAHVSIGARDIARARRFYDAALKPLGYTCLSSGEGSLGYGAKAAGFLGQSAPRIRCRPTTDRDCTSASPRPTARLSMPSTRRR